MDNFKILIVDDERLARQKIRRLLGNTKQIFQIEEAVNGIEALEKIPRVAPHLIFLDVQMPGLTGFEVLQHLEARPFKVIFQTAYDEYAISAFEENACDYLLKPFTEQRFEKALSRALSSFGGPPRLNELEERLLNNKNYLQKLTVKQGSKLKLVDIDDIVCFVSKDHYTCVYTDNMEYICDLSLAHLSDRLSPEIFWRLHRNNILKISTIKSVSGGENMSVELSNGLKLYVSRNNRRKVKELLAKAGG